MTKTGAFLIAAALGIAAPANAQTNGFVPCEEHWSARLTTLYVGADGEGIRSFYDGAVTLLRIDTEEPAAASSGVIVMMWTGSELADIERHCWVNWGHGLVQVDDTQSSYDPADGLTLTIPTSRYDEMGEQSVGSIRFRLNAATGTLTELD